VTVSQSSIQPGPLPSSGTPFPISWGGFLQLVLELTVEAYQRMNLDGVVAQDWEEDAFSARLTEDYIQPLLREKELFSFVATCQAPVYTREMKSGKATTKKAKKIDIKIYMTSWDHVDVYFAWECKKVGEPKLYAKCKGLSSEYVKEGMARFLDEDYSAQVANAGMLGFVLAGDVDKVVGSINRGMLSVRRSRRFKRSDRLMRTTPIRGYSHAFISKHKRNKSRRELQLHHLFLVFDFSASS
jgi:hypothetical protein